MVRFIYELEFTKSLLWGTVQPNKCILSEVIRETLAELQKGLWHKWPMNSHQRLAKDSASRVQTSHKFS